MSTQTKIHLTTAGPTAGHGTTPKTAATIVTVPNAEAVLVVRGDEADGGAKNTDLSFF